MSSQDAHSLFKKIDADSLFSNENKSIKEEKEKAVLKKILNAEEEKRKKNAKQLVVQQKYHNKILAKGKHRLCLFIDAELVERVDTEIGYETNRSDKFEQIIRFFLEHKDKV